MRPGLRAPSADSQLLGEPDAPQLSSRFAAKEAVMKALGTGIRGVGWREIEVVRQRGQAPQIKLYGGAAARARRIGLSHIALSLSHSKAYAVAVVVGDSTKGNILGLEASR